MTQDQINQLIIQLLSGSVMTLKIFFFTLVFALPLGLLLTVGRMRKFFVIQYPIRLFLLVMRGTPLILQLVAVFFLLPIGFGIHLERFTAAIVAMSLNYAAYFAEIYRSGFESMPKGQYEAAAVLGFSKSQRFFKIILPQVIKKIIPPMGSEFMTLVKDTALVSTIGITELYLVAKDTMSAKASVIPIVAAGVFYLIMNGIVAQAFHMLEKKLSYYK
ncbi:MAG: amino acid ABC transporter permease [bacterium]|nr:amino acid ABC transporter permease [bacterium]